MNLSLNEIEALAKRAVRGAGYHWGAAEDAAKATRWLCLQGFDGAEELANLLVQDFAPAIKDHSPKSTRPEWRSAGDLCPIMAGVLLSDCAEHLRRGPITLRDVAVPVLLLPFAGNVARRLGVAVSIDCEGWTAVTDGIHTDAKNSYPRRASEAVVRVGGALDDPRIRYSRAAPDPEALSFLNRLAHRTYAPATEQSRLMGAGAGLSDND